MEKFLSQQFESLEWLKDQEVALVVAVVQRRNVARIHQAEHSYPIGGVHNYTMTNKDIDEVFDIIRKSDRDDLTNLDGLSRDRVDIILPLFQCLKRCIKL